MVKHNNVIPNNHFRKHWQRNVRVWLNQAQRKHTRLITRRAKAAALSPRPLEALRPAVRCQTQRYNHRTRLGRGFTLAEIKAAGLGVQFARSVGISVDHRRKNRNQYLSIFLALKLRSWSFNDLDRYDAFSIGNVFL